MANILGNFIKGKDGVNVAAQGAGSGSGTPNVRPANANISNIRECYGMVSLSII